MTRVIPAAILPQEIEVLPLRDFMIRPGKIAQSGVYVRVPPGIANTAIACGNARLPTFEDRLPPPDDSVSVENRDPAALNREPKPRRR